MIFAVFDLWTLTVFKNCSFCTFILAVLLPVLVDIFYRSLYDYTVRRFLNNEHKVEASSVHLRT